MRRYFAGPISSVALAILWTQAYVAANSIPAFPQSVTAGTVVSTFDVGDEGWTIVGDAQGASAMPTHHLEGGYSGGYISATDDVTGGVWYFNAPAKFLGDQSIAFSRSLKFILKQSQTDAPFDEADVVLEGGGLQLVYDASANPGSEWSSYNVPLRPGPEWTIAGTGSTATEETFQTVLGNLTALRIRGEYRTGADTGSLDFVRLGARSEVIGYNFNGTVSCDQANNSPVGDVPHMTVSDFTRTGITCDAGIDVFNSTGWPTENNLPASAYAGFNAVSEPAITMMTTSFDTIAFTVRRSEFGPDSGGVDVLIDDHELVRLGNWRLDDVLARRFAFPMPDLTASSKLELRFYGSRATLNGTGQNTGTLRFDDVSLTLEVHQTGGGTVSSEEENVLSGFMISAPYPNPFNSQTQLILALDRPEHVTVVLYNTIGQRIGIIIDRMMAAGEHYLSVHGRDLPSGTYLIQANARGRGRVRLVILRK